MRFSFSLYVLMLCFVTQKNVAQTISPDTTLFNSYVNQFHSQRSSNLDSAHQFLTKLDALTRPYSQSEYRMKYLNLLGGYYGLIRKDKEALTSFKAASVLAQKLGDTLSLVKILFNVSTREGALGNNVAAIEGYERLHDLVKSSGKDYGIRSTLYANMIHFMIEVRDYEKANFYSKIFKENRYSYNDSIMYSITHQYLLFEQSKYKEVISIAEKGQNFIKADDYYAKSLLYPALAIAYIRSGNLSMGEETLVLAQNVYKKLGTDKDINLLLGFGEMALAKHEYQKAVDFFKEGLATEIAKTKPFTRALLLDKLHMAYKGLGDYREAYRLFYQSVILKDSTDGVEKKKYIDKMAAQYQLKDKERIIAQQDKERILQQKLINTEKLQKRTFMVLLMVSLLFLYFCIYLIRRGAKARALLAQQRSKLDIYAAQLEKANHMRDKLFAMLSHDLRSPVNNLINSLELYKPKDGQAFFKVLNAINNIQLILNNLLKWSHLQLKDSQPQVQEIHIEVWIEAILRQLSSTIAEKDITVLHEFKHQGLRASADEEYLMIIGRNLISNAVKYTPAGGFVKINSYVQDRKLNMEVRDSGVGIDTETLSQIFNYPSSHKGTSGETGSGLGLTLCHELIKKMGGSIRINSQKDRGTSVTVTLDIYNGNVV